MDVPNNNKYALRGGYPRGFAAPHTLSGMSPATPILVALSGGADSVTLLDATVKYSASAGGRVCAAHVNHMIRGAEAERDEKFCREIAERYGIELFVLRRDVPAFAKQTSQSLESAAREVRYSFFAEIMRKEHIPLLAVAHNSDDNLETVLHHLARGSGLSGLCGIPQVRECDGGTLIRPLLGVSRACILEYCEKNGLAFVTDSTNYDTDYARNRIRHNVIPELRALNPSIEAGTFGMTALLREDRAYLEKAGEKFLAENSADGGMDTQALCRESRAVSSRAVIGMYGHLSAGASLGQTHVSAILRLCAERREHSSLSLPGNVYACIEGGRLFLTREAPVKDAAVEFYTELKPGENYISQTNTEIVIGRTQNKINIYKKSIQFHLDSATINGALIARSRAPGDRILSGGMHKSVKKLLCDKKVPLELRRRLPVICDADGIVAVPFVGVRDGSRVKAMRDSDAENLLSVGFYVF